MDLLLLNEYNRKASQGKDYPELNDIYTNWCCDLHSKGNFIDNQKLIIISQNGLIRWYFKKLAFFDIDYNYKYIENFIKEPQSITFYDIKTIKKIADYFGVNNDYISNLNLDKYNYKYEYFFLNYKYDFIKKNKINIDILNKYCNCTFGTYLIDKMGYDNLKEHLVNIYTEYLKYDDFFNNKSLFNNFLKLYPKIIDWGIIYHKFKVILEKISTQKHKDIYIVDNFVDMIQQYIFTLVSKYCENMLLNENIDIYIKDEEQIYNEKYFESYPDEVLKHFDFTTII